MPEIIDVQTALVAAHRDGLSRDVAALRAERVLVSRRHHDAAAADLPDRRARLSAGRLRIGRWLVGLGEAIAGTRAVTPSAQRAIKAPISPGPIDGPCDDGHDQLAAAA